MNNEPLQNSNYRLSKHLASLLVWADPKRLLTQLPTLVRTATQIATFKAGDKRKTTHRHLFLPKDYSGTPTASIYTPWSEEEVLSHLTSGWGEGAITELKLEYLYGPEPEVSGE